MPVNDSACVRFLQWALPQLKLRWAGFRNVHKRVCKHLGRRLAELGLSDLEAYKTYLARHPDEWQQLDRFCRIVITRFYRDKRVFDELATTVLPCLATHALAEDRSTLAVWSIGSASGEEPYTLAILWHLRLAERFAPLRMDILATEIDPRLLERSRIACYPPSTLKNLPAALRAAAFVVRDQGICLRPELRERVTFRQQDIRISLPDQTFDLILCRNLVFTYFELPQQRTILARLLSRLHPGGWLVLGVHENLPAGVVGLDAVSPRLGLYRVPGD